MPARLTNDVERERIEKRNKERGNPWELFTSTSIVHTVHKARDLGWKDKKVQVRGEQTAEDVVTYYVEPYESDCGCKGILKYEDFFD